jgi:nucleotide-binding universal stress UspA family protein
MYKKMLVILDGSKLAEVVFSYAQELAARLNLCLELLNVCTTQEIGQLPMRRAYIEHMAEVLQKKADAIRSQSGQSITCEVAAKGTVVVGYPSEEILKYIDENNVDLLMLATHGSSGIKSWNLGSVANQVVHASKIPVWIVPSELNEAVIYDTLPKRTMVIPLDGSKLSEGVVPYAVSIAKQRGAESEIIVLYVENYQEARSLLEIKQIKENRERIQKYLEEIVKRIKDQGIPARSDVLMGEPAFAIIDYLKENPPQLIAMATHAHSGLSKMVFGSVTENVLQMIKRTPMLLVRPKE